MRGTNWCWLSVKHHEWRGCSSRLCFFLPTFGHQCLFNNRGRHFLIRRQKLYRFSILTLQTNILLWLTFYKSTLDNFMYQLKGLQKWHFLAYYSLSSGHVMRETVRWTYGAACTICPECISKSAGPLQLHWSPLWTDGLDTESVSQGPPAELHRPEVYRATAVQIGPSAKCTSCVRWRGWGTSSDQLNMRCCSRADCPGCCSLSELDPEVLFCPFGIWACRNTEREKDKIQV